MLHKVHKAWHEKVIFNTGSPVFGVVIDQDSRNKSQNGAVLLLLAGLCAVTERERETYAV
jgi:hypothetical protein